MMLLVDHISVVLGHQIINRSEHCDNLQQLGQALQDEWQGKPRGRGGGRLYKMNGGKGNQGGGGGAGFTR